MDDKNKKNRVDLTEVAEWLWNNLPVFFALLTLLWVIFAAIIWPSQNARAFRQSFDLGNGSSLEVWGPEVVPLEAPVDLHFALHQEQASGMPVMLRVTIPEDLVVLAPSPHPLVGQVTLEFSGQSSEESQAIQLNNARRLASLVAKPQSLAIEQFQTSQTQTAPVWSRVGEVHVRVEQVWRGVLRQAGGGGSSAPLGPVITLVISLGTFFYQYLSRIREEKEKREQEAKEKEQERARQANDSMMKIRQALKESNLETAEKNLLQIEQQGLEAHLESGDLALARQLVKLARGHISSFTFDTLSQEWLEAAAGAVIYAAKHNPTDRLSLEQLMRSFPTEKLKDADIQGTWQVVRENIGAAIPSQAREWPRPTVKTWPSLVRSPADDLKYNPFPHDRAEEEEPYLFAKPTGLFWSEPRAFQALKDRRSAWVTGEPGSGKTALALAIGKYLLSDEAFSEKGFACYFRELPSIVEVRRALAGRLLDSILQNPSYLPLGEEQNRLLAEILQTALSASLILSRIEKTAQAADWPWLKETENEIQKTIWKAEARTRLRLLEEAISKVNATLSESLWPKAWTTALNFLGFESCTRLAFDLNASPHARGQEADLWDTLAHWTEYGIQTLVFSLPEKRLERAFAGWASRLELTWEETDMKNMVEWRWKQVYSNRPFASLFENPAAEAFFFQQAQINPARLIRLWNLVFEEKVTIPISTKQIESAAKRCN
ncbi:MAG: ATP-binding protein [Anaerolineales bacterium]|nr:ATP-binding protein [Anaerolineales bacterium]